MPVLDLNSLKMGQQMVTVLDTTEELSDFWVQNAAFIAWVLIVVILLSCFLFAFFFLKKVAKKAFDAR